MRYQSFYLEARMLVKITFSILYFIYLFIYFFLKNVHIDLVEALNLAQSGMFDCVFLSLLVLKFGCETKSLTMNSLYTVYLISEVYCNMRYSSYPLKQYKQHLRLDVSCHEKTFPLCKLGGATRQCLLST